MGGAGKGPAVGRTPSSGPSAGPRSNRGGGNGKSRLPSNLDQLYHITIKST